MFVGFMKVTGYLIVLLLLSGGIDYGPFPSSTIQLIAILPANSPETVFGMIIHEDEVVENSESFSVSMRLLTEQSGATSETVVVIQDNDCKMILVVGGEIVHLVVDLIMIMK